MKGKGALRLGLVVVLAIVRHVHGYVNPPDSFDYRRVEKDSTVEKDATVEKAATVAKDATVEASSLNCSCDHIKDELGDCHSLTAALEKSKSEVLQKKQELQMSVDELESRSVVCENKMSTQLEAQKVLEARILETVEEVETVKTKLNETNILLEKTSLELEYARGHAAASEEARIIAEGLVSTLRVEIEDVKKNCMMQLDVARKEITSEFAVKFQWQERRNQELSSAQDTLQKQLQSKDMEFNKAKEELLLMRYELIQVNQRVRDMEKERDYYWDLLISFKESLSIGMTSVKDIIVNNVTMERAQKIYKSIASFISSVWNSNKVREYRERAQPHYDSVVSTIEPAWHATKVQYEKHVQPVYNSIVSAIQPFWNESKILYKQHVQPLYLSVVAAVQPAWQKSKVLYKQHVQPKCQSAVAAMKPAWHASKVHVDKLKRHIPPSVSQHHGKLASYFCEFSGVVSTFMKLQEVPTLLITSAETVHAHCGETFLYVEASFVTLLVIALTRFMMRRG